MHFQRLGVLSFVMAAALALMLSGCGGGGGSSPSAGPQQPGGGVNPLPPTTPEPPRTSSGWWLPDNTHALVQGGTLPSLSAGAIPQKLVDTGDGGLVTSELVSIGFGRQYDGAYVDVLGGSAIRRIVIGTTWESRTVADVNGVSFAERRALPPSVLAGTPAEITWRRVVGFLDYANFGIWMNEVPGAAGLGVPCCQWSIANEVIVPFDHGGAPLYFGLGTYSWRGGMIGVKKREPESTIMGHARIDLDMNVPGTDRSNTLDVSFTNIRDLSDGSRVADMSWRLNAVGERTVGTRFVDQAGRLVSGQGEVALTWSGPNHNDVVGLYDNGTYLGAFGGTKQP